MSDSSIFQQIPDLTPTEETLLADVFHSFPRVLEGFEQFTETPPSARIARASEVVAEQPRSGWLRVGIERGFRDIRSTYTMNTYGPRLLMLEDAPPVTESVLEHCAEMAELYAIVFRATPNVFMGVEVSKFHDFPEAITGDFTPKDQISGDYKERLEVIAANLLTEGRREGDLLALHLYNCMSIFAQRERLFDPMASEMLQAIASQREMGTIQPHQESLVAYLERIYSTPIPNMEAFFLQLKDADRLQMAVRSMRILKEKHSRLSPEEAKEKIDEFWVWIDKRIVTPQGRTFFNDLKREYLCEEISYREGIHRALAHMSAGF